MSGVEPWNFVKKKLQHKCFPVNIGKFLRTPTLKNICERLVLSQWNQSIHSKQRLMLCENEFIPNKYLCLIKLTNFGILHYLWSAYLSKCFFQFVGSIFIFSINSFLPIFIFSQKIFSIDFAWWESLATPHGLYCDLSLLQVHSKQFLTKCCQKIPLK